VIKSINTYYTTQEELELFINDERIQDSSSLLIQVFSAINDKSFISTLLSELTQLLPNAVIIGSTTDGEIMNGKVSSGKVVLSFTQFEHTTLKAASIEHKLNGYYSGQYLAKELIGEDTKLLIAFVDGLHTNGEEFLNGIDSVNDEIVIAGGHAGDNSNFIETSVFTKEHIFTQGAVGVTLNSRHLHIHTDYSFNWHPIGNELTITKAEGNRVYTIDGKSAVDTYAYYLGEDIAKGLPGIGIEFPLIVNRNGSNVSRASIAREDDGSLIVGGNLYTGEKVRIGYGNSKEILKKSQKIVDTTSQKSSEVIFIYSCMTRKYFMGDKVESETLPLQHIAPVSGFFTYGEFFTSNKKELFNQTMTLVSLSESDNISKTTLNIKPKQVDINSASIDALIHLINISSKEIKEQTETLKASNKLNKQLKERMELALIGSNDGVWDWNLLDDTVYFSPRWKEMLGYRDDEITNEFSTWQTRVHPDDLDDAFKDINKNINKETEYYENIHRLKHKNGHWVWILDRGKTLFDESGKAIRMIGTHTDITEEKEDQLKLVQQAQIIKQLKERQELALKGSKTSVLDWDFTDNSMYIPPSWKEMLGFRDDELPNSTSTWFQHAHPDDKKGVLSLLRKHEKDQIRYFEFNHRLKHKDGHWVWVLGRAEILFDENGKKLRMIGTHTDITDEKELQLKLVHQAQIIDQIHDGIITTDLEGHIVNWNEGAEKLFGYSQSEVMGKHISLLYHQEDMPVLKNDIRASLLHTGLYNGDMTFVKKDKDTISIALSLSTLKDEKGNATGIIGINQDISRRKKAEDDLYHQVHHDALTGLPNRVLFYDRLEQGIIKAKRHSEVLALFFIDLDKFKHINDSLGHMTGDSVLKIVSKRLKDIIRKEDTVARLSGDEFTIIIEELKNPQDASILAEKILAILKEPIHIDNHTLYVSGSVGISMYPGDATDGHDLLKYADTAMYKAKEEGRNNFQFYSPEMTAIAMKRIVMKTCLRQAIDQAELLINYQPQINSCRNELIGLEALVRWQHPTMGLLSPDKFIPLAEDTGMIIEVDKWVMRTSMKQVSDWYKEGLKPGVLALNLSVKQLESHDFIEVIKESIQAYDFKAEWLELEITEGQMMTKPEEVISKLEEINDLGVSISIDDFGTGYSSLSLLKRLPIHRLKIDQSFIQDIPDDEEDAAIVNAIIALARSLKLDLVAEGVETSEQKEFLVNSGCINMQGYYFSHPVSAEEMKDILLDRSKGNL